MWESKRKSLILEKKETICICVIGKVQAFYQTQQAAKRENVPLCMDKSVKKNIHSP